MEPQWVSTQAQKQCEQNKHTIKTNMLQQNYHTSKTISTRAKRSAREKEHTDECNHCVLINKWMLTMHNIEEKMLGECTAVIGWLGYTQWVDKDEGRPPSGWLNALIPPPQVRTRTPTHPVSRRRACFAAPDGWLRRAASAITSMGGGGSARARACVYVCVGSRCSLVTSPPPPGVHAFVLLTN